MNDAPVRRGDPAHEELFRAIVESAPEAIVVVTSDGEISFFNPAAERLFGYGSADVVGRSITVLVPTQPNRRADPVRWLARWAAEPPTEQSRYLEFQARRRDGSQMPVDVRVAQARVSGEPRFVITVRDDSARRQAQTALKDSNLVAARTLLVAEDAIVSCDAQQTITLFNLAAERMFGYRMEEAIGQPLSLLLPPDARAAHRTFIEAFGASSAPSRMMGERQEIRGLRRTGEVFPIEATITKVAVGGAVTYSAHLRDISERKAQAEKLAESERRFRAVFQHAAAAIALLSPDGRVLEINPAAQALTVGDAILVGRPLWELPWLGSDPNPADDAARSDLRDAIEQCAAGSVVRRPALLRDKDGVRRLELILTPIRDDAGKVIYILPEGREIGPSEG